MLAVVVPVSVIVVVAWIDPLSAAIMLLTLPLIPLFMWLVGRSTARRARSRWQALTLLATHFLDVVRGLPTLRVFNRGEAQAETIALVTEEYRRTTMGTLRIAFLSGAVLELAATLGIALVAVTVGVRLVDGGIAFEPALTVLVLAPELYLPLRNLVTQFHAAADGLGVSQRLLDLADGPSPARRGVSIPPSPRDARIRLDGVSFSYPGRAGCVLDSVGLEIDPGETVALVGPSGSGKSTLAALLLCLVEPTGGRLTVGDVDLADCDHAAWRAHVAWVPQRPTLFHATVADNIRLGDPAADDRRVRAAAELAGADRFVAALPDAYATIVGDGGRPVSAGERQRIALARAFLRDAPLVVLDEPTANLDGESAAVIGDAIERLRRNRSVLIVTHRVELVPGADRVAALVEGRLLTRTAEAA